MLARTVALCAALSALLGGGVVGAESRNLLLADKASQSVADVDFSLPPIWHSLYKCGEQISNESCLLQRMTETPTGTAPSVIVSSALHLAVQIDRGRGDDVDGLISLRAAQAYLVAAVYEAEVAQSDDARTHFRLALQRAADVPQKYVKYDTKYGLQSSGASNLGNPRPSNVPNGRVLVGMQAKEDLDKYYPEAQLVREYATRALAALGAN